MMFFADRESKSSGRKRKQGYKSKPHVMQSVISIFFPKSNLFSLSHSGFLLGNTEENSPVWTLKELKHFRF